MYDYDWLGTYYGSYYGGVDDDLDDRWFSCVEVIIEDEKNEKLLWATAIRRD